jgi:NTP pyrophosphatase (non-canonical NTP hydrolase)
VELDAYQRGALRTAASRETRNELLHLVLGLVGESGEIAEKFKKWVRDLADCLDLSPDDIAATNLAKLAGRQSRGVLGGSGDDR